ncbi:Na+/H+ antiporter NhaA [Enhygromyxa salina]|uniref:Na(+)/H(+) antiporter NhaA n=1 Tax=Enhygromyxa salina TaxID=215803 RepID=A0A2S9YLJ2_9BACT|nr:Na+/H+ antiporter NhaA [Enhygromyxa salina]PRQ05975.1 Na(+)/H(+) antiporter NhaA [Enhygromyxa salina]
MAIAHRSRLRSRLETRARSAERVRALLPLTRFLHLGEIAGGPLLIAAVVALIWANIPGAGYTALWRHELTLSLGWLSRTEPLNRWVTDALLPLFFFVAGLEIKRELVHGELDSWRRAALPLAVAIGGIVVPMGCYLAFTHGSPESRGWAIPVATDIAFALALLGLLGDRAPRSVKVLALAFAAIDDIGATLIVAVFYSAHLSWPALVVAAGFLLLILSCRWLSVRGELIYWLLGAGFVASVLQGGIHSTVAGLVLGMLAPSHSLFSREDLVARLDEVSGHISDLDARLAQFEESGQDTECHEYEELLERQAAYLAELEELTVGYEAPADRELRRVTPWVSYLVLPVFGLANAGVPITTDALGSLVTLGASLAIVVALTIGKPVGFLLAAWLALRTGLAQLPEGVGWRHLAVVGMLAGVGFTVSLFIAQLAFTAGGGLDRIKLAVLLGSFIAAALGTGTGYALLRPSESRASPT